MSNKIKKIAVIGVLLAMQVVLSRFCSYSVWNMKIGFAFIPVVICAMLYGPVYAAILGGLSDFLGAILFPIGAYFPGFTLTAAVTGLIFGLLFYRKANILRILLSVLSEQILCGLIVNSLWISVLYGSKYDAVFISRIPQVLILIVIQTICIFIIEKFIINKLKKII